MLFETTGVEGSPNYRVDTNMADPGFEPSPNFPDQYWLTFIIGKNCTSVVI